MNDMPAFPSHGTMGEVVQEGMSLRDYFAAKAMHALLMDAAPGLRHGRDGYLERLSAILAKVAFGMADSMLSERDSQKQSATP